MRTEVIVDEVIPLTDTIFKVFVKPKVSITYESGQYLEVIAPMGSFPFSIANAPLGAEKIELHIRHATENPFNQWLLDTIKTKGRLEISAPKGDCRLSVLDKTKPIVLIAGGTGFAPIKAMIEQLLYDGDKRVMHFFWLANKKADFYLDETVKAWANHMAHFTYTPLFTSRHQKSPDLCGVMKALYKEKASDFQAVLAGPFELIFSLKEILLTLGIASDHILSDAFSYKN